MEIENKYKNTISNLNELSSYIIARRRVLVLRSHLYPSCGNNKVGMLKNSGTIPEKINSFALVPWPGTSEHRDWMDTIKKSSSIEAIEILNDWTSGFFKSGMEIEVALRRIRVLNAHLSALPYNLTIKDVW